MKRPTNIFVAVISSLPCAPILQAKQAPAPNEI